MKASESDVSSNQAGNWLSREAQKIFRHVVSLLVDAMQYEVTGILKCQKPLFRN
jgi:phage terminase small subunit